MEVVLTAVIATLTTRTKQAMQKVTEKGVTVQWGWCKGHSKLEWNEIADKLADKGRTGAAEEEPVRRGAARAKKRVLRVEQLVDAEAVRRAAENRETAQEAKRWAKVMQPRGDGTAVVRTCYTRNTPYSRRNAEGVSLQFCSKGLRWRIAGQIYTEIDIRGSHPTMLRARLASVGKRVPLLDEWVLSRDECVKRLREEIAAKHERKPDEREVKELVLAMINGARVEKWMREKLGMNGAPQRLASFAREMSIVRAKVETWFPEVWSHTAGAGSDWKRRNRAVHFVMTALEDDVLEVMREVLLRFGVQCDS